MTSTRWSSGLSVTADGLDVVAHAGSLGLRLLAERTGLTGQLSTAMARGSLSRSMTALRCWSMSR